MDMTKISAAAVCGIGVALGAAGTGIAHAAPTPAAAVLPIPAEYRHPLIAAGKLCPQIDAPLVAAVINTDSGWKADLVDPLGRRGPGQLLPATAAKYSAPGESVTTPDGGTLITGRALCAIAQDVENKVTLGADVTAEQRRALYMTAYNAGSDYAARTAGNTPAAGPRSSVEEIKWEEITEYVDRIERSYQEYKNQI